MATAAMAPALDRNSEGSDPAGRAGRSGVGGAVEASKRCGGAGGDGRDCQSAASIAGAGRIGSGGISNRNARRLACRPGRTELRPPHPDQRVRAGGKQEAPRTAAESGSRRGEQRAGADRPATTGQVRAHGASADGGADSIAPKPGAISDGAVANGSGTTVGRYGANRAAGSDFAGGGEENIGGDRKEAAACR